MTETANLESWDLVQQLKALEQSVRDVNARLKDLEQTRKETLEELKPLENQLRIRLRNTGGVLVFDGRAYFTDNMGELVSAKVLSAFDVDTRLEEDAKKADLDPATIARMVDHVQS